MRIVVAAAGAFVVGGAAAPFLGLQMANPGGFTEVPAYWTQAADWLASHDGNGRALLVPGSRFPEYTWGSAGDEPLQALAGAPWDIRSAIPLSNAGHIRWLDSVEREIADGRGGRELAAQLAVGGVRYLVARNDLSYGPAGATRPIAVNTALTATPGVSLVASFGPVTGGGSTPDQFHDQGLTVALPALQVYEVSARPELRVSLVPASAVGQVVGGAESVGGPGQEDLGVSVVGTPDAVTAPAARRAAGGPRVLTDTPRRREENFGIGTFGVSQTLAVDDPLRISKPARDYGASSQPGAEATARLVGAASVTASSSASDADSYPGSDPAAMPYSAFDASLRTLWRPNPIKDPVGSWVGIDFGRSVGLGGGAVILDEGTAITGLQVRTDQGELTLPVQNGAVALPSVETAHLILTIVGVAGSPAQIRAAGIRSVSIPGYSVARTVQLPDDPWPGGPDRVVLTGDVGHGSCLFLGQRPLCGVGVARVGEDAAGLDRTFSLPQDFRATVSMTARPLPSAGLTAAVERALRLPVHASASSAAVPDVAGSALSAVDGDLGTAWVASAGDPDPALALSWHGARWLDHLQVLVDQYATATRPTHLRITSDAGTREADLDPQGWVRFAPLRTDRMTLHLSAGSLASTVDAYTVGVTRVGVGVSDVRIEGLTPELVFSRAALGNAVTFPCGRGPALRIDGVSFPTRVDTTVGAVLRGQPVDVTVCRTAAAGSAAPSTTTLTAGQVRVEAGTPGSWDVASVVLRRASDATDAAATPAQPVVREWGATERTLELGPRSTAVVLAVAENANGGWTARLGATPLHAVTVNGWQQGFLVPAGPAGPVQLSYRVDRPVRVGMATGGALALVLVLGAAVPGRGRRWAVVDPAGPRARVAALVVALFCIPLVAGWWGAAVAVCTTALVAVVGGRWSPWAPPWLVEAAAAGAVLVAGLVLALGHWGSVTYLADRPLAQLLCAAGLSFVALSLWWPAPAPVVPPGCPRRSAAVVGPVPPDAPAPSGDAPGIGS